jgi:hypothetical protein
MSREKLVNAIIEYYGSEVSEFTKQDFIDLAKESEDQLLDRLIGILEWYHNEVTELNEQ